MTISVREAGRKGGLAVLRNRGREFYREIGRKGQQAMREKYPLSMAHEWGKRGGRPKKPKLSEMGGGKQIITKGGVGPA